MIKSAKTKQPHYLGNVVSYSGNNSSSSYQERVLVDGQQRITTILLLLCAIKDVINDDDIKENLLNNYLINNSKKERRVRLKQASGDITVFESILTNQINSLNSKQKENQLLTKFSKVYYILDSLEYFDEDDIYVAFKEHYIFEKKSHKEILDGMRYSSIYFSMIEKNTIENDRIKRNIKYLKKLQYDDLLPLLTYLYQETIGKDKNLDELDRVIDLLVDFMFRYRIVKPYTGGGPTKKLVLNLLVKLKNKDIKICYDDILFELSNSMEYNQRFPLDDEFKDALVSGDKDKYKRELLLRLEDKETKNIKIDVDSDLTLEHLMPQTQSKWWIKNMGGKEKYQLAIENYLNSIGNLAILSRGYNTINSNDPWSEKLLQLATAQFKVTSEVAKNKEWKEKEIVARNKKLSNRICKYITGPTLRVRSIDSMKSNDVANEDFESGSYNLFDTSFPESNIVIKGIKVDDKYIKVSSWREFFNKLCYLIRNENPNLFDAIVLKNVIHKNKSSHKENEKDPIISKNKNYLQGSMLIEGSEYYTETCLSQSRIIVYARQLIESMNFDKDIFIDLE